MSFDQDIVDMRTRIRKAERDRDQWRIAGKQEKYLESYFLVDALDVELDRMRKQRIESTARSASSARVDAPPQPPGAHAGGPATNDAGERERLMAELSITAAGQQYQYAHYRYDRLDDAVAYARKQRAAPSANDADPLPPARIVEAPDELQRRRMSRHGITFQEGVYHLGPYRYDHLADAMRYARMRGVDTTSRDPIRNSSLWDSLS
jgi:hypothetical protein